MAVKPEVILSQEEQLQFNEFTNEDALQLGLSIIGIAKEEIGRGIAVHVEFDECPLFTHFMEGTSENNLYWVKVKKNVVKHFGHSSLYVGESFKQKGSDFQAETGFSEQEYRAEGGSFPLVIRERGRVGTITVSGLTGEEDHALAAEGIKRLLEAKKNN